MRLKDLATAINGTIVLSGESNGSGSDNPEITGVSCDSRYIREGEAFFCLTGGSLDGGDFAAEAAERGAAAIVTEKAIALPKSARGNVPKQILVPDTRKAMSLAACAFYGYPANDVKTVGVTGTNGKTTITYLLSAIFEAAGKKTGVIGTTGLVYAGKKIDPALTTPDPAFLQKTLADMRDHGVEYAFLEVSAHAVHYEKIAGIPFYARIFTNCTQDHLDFFKTMERYARTKESFFLNAESDGFFVVNTDDGTGRKIADGLKMQGKKAFTYGLESPSDAFAVIADESPAGSRCLMNFSDTLCRAAIPLAGRHNVYNALAAASLAFLAGIPPETIAAGLKNAVPPRGRLQRICGVPGAEIFIDFAHTPDGLEKSLNAVRPFCKGKLYCLFGCGGNRDHTKRPKMGEVAAKNADFSYLTSDNPRYEDPCDIIRSIEAGYRRFSDRYVCIPDRKKAIFYAVDRLKKGDVLLIAGKGGEEYQEIMGVKYEYDDESVTEEAIFSRGGKG